MTVGPTSLSLLSYLSMFCCRFSWEIARSWLRMPVTSALMANIWVSSRISMKFHKEKDVEVPKYAKILIVSPELKAFLEFVGFAMTKALLLFGGEANTLSMALSHERKNCCKAHQRIKTQCLLHQTSVHHSSNVSNKPSASKCYDWLFKSFESFQDQGIHPWEKSVSIGTGSEKHWHTVTVAPRIAALLRQRGAQIPAV